MAKESMTLAERIDTAFGIVAPSFVKRSIVHVTRRLNEWCDRVDAKKRPSDAEKK